MLAFNFIAGTFNSAQIYTFTFTPPSKDSKARLEVIQKTEAVGAHSWLHLNHLPNGKKFLYCTGWTEPPCLASYEISDEGRGVQLINCVETKQRSGYVCASERVVYSAGAAVGEVFAIDNAKGGFVEREHDGTNGAIAEEEQGKKGKKFASPPIQRVSFVDEASGTKQKNDGSVMDFGGIRHGAHSADLSPDGKVLYVADIGRNCIWTYAVEKDGKLRFGEKCPATRANDGPRHAWPHPGGKVVYSLQEHSSMVDIFEVTGDERLGLSFVEGVRCLPEGRDEGEYWADEVRCSLSDGERPKYLYASNRGLKEGTKGYVCAYALTEDGKIDSGKGDKGLLDMWETPTSGGWANAVQPGPTVEGIEYVSLTDSELGFLSVLGFDGRRFEEVARVGLGEGVGAATVVWL